MHPWKLASLLVATATLSACASQHATVIETGPGNREAAAQLAIAQRLIAQGIPDTAIREHLDPLIASYERQYAHSGKTVYSARTMPESFMYAVLDAVPESAPGQPARDQRVKSDVVVVDGGWSDALETKGYALFELHHYDEAEATLREALRLAPLYSTAWSELGNLYQSQKKWPEAMEAFRQAQNAADMVKEDDPHRPHYTRALRGQGFVLTEQGRLDDSEALYKECLALDPDDGHAKNELAYIAELRANQHRAATGESR